MNIFYQNRQDIFHCFLSYNNTYPSHFHRQIELLYVADGSIEAVIDNKITILKKGDIAIIFPSICHSYFTHKSSVILLLFFDIEFCQDFTNIFFSSIPVTPFVDNSLLNAELKNILNLFICSCESTPFSLPIYRGYLTVLLSHLFSLLSFKEKIYSHNNSICQKLLYYIDTHFTEQITLDILSKELGVSSFYISHIFSDKLHQSFSDYLNYARIEFACMLLLSTTYSITQIAYDCGFSSTRTFYRAFQSIHHTTPTNYRKNNKSPKNLSNEQSLAQKSIDTF